MRQRLRNHLRREWRHASMRGPCVIALVGIACVAFDHLVLARFPMRVIDFMMKGFQVEDRAAVVVLNDMMAVYFPTFFVGLSGSIGVLLAARDEHRLELLLAKPIRARDFIAARAFPVLWTTTLVGVTISAASALAVALDAGEPASVTVRGTFGAGAALTGLAVLLLAALQLAYVRIRDPLMGLLVGCGLWLATMIPTAVLLYRPDVFDGHRAIALGCVLPSLLWHADVSAWLGPLAMAITLPLALLLTTAAGSLLERTDAI